MASTPGIPLGPLAALECRDDGGERTAALAADDEIDVGPIEIGGFDGRVMAAHDDGGARQPRPHQTGQPGDIGCLVGVAGEPDQVGSKPP